MALNTSLGTLTDPLPDMVDPIGSGMLDDPFAGMMPAQSIKDGTSIFDYVDDPDIEPLMLSIPSPFEAGIDMGQAMMWKGGEALAQAFDMDSAEDFFANQAEINLNDATVPLDSMLEKVAFAAGTAGVGLSAALGAAAAAPFVGLSTGFGSMVGGVVAGMGMTAGDMQLKAEELDPEYRAGFGHLATSAAIGVGDAYALGKLKTFLSPVRESIRGAINGSMDISKGVGAVGQIVSTAAKVGATEGVQDLGTGIGANYFTGKEIDQSRINALADSAVEEMVIGSILGLPVGGLNIASTSIAKAQTEFDENRKLAGDVIALQDGAGKLQLNEENLAPVEGSAKQPGNWSIRFNQLTGNATSALRLRYNQNPWVQELMKQFNLKIADRQVGKSTLSEKARQWEAELNDVTQAFFNAPLDEQVQAWETKAKGELDLENPIHKSLYDTLNVKIPEGYRAASRGKGGFGGMFDDDTYLPSHNALDWKKMSEDPELMRKAIAALEKNKPEMSQDSRQALLDILDNRKQRYLAYGNEFHYGSAPNSQIETYLSQALDEGRAPKTLKKLIKQIEKRRERELKKSPLNLKRELEAFGQEFLTEYYRSDMTPADIMRQHIRMVTEHAAVVDAFGVDNHIFDEVVAKAIDWGHKNGQAIEPKDITKIYDVLRTQQRIHLKPMNPQLRNIQNKARALVNIKLLGLASLVSIPEALVIALNTGGMNALKGLVQTMGLTKRSAIAAEDIGLGADAALNNVLNRVGEESFDIGKLEQTFFKMTGLPHLQHFLTTWATRSQDIYIRRLLNDLDSGKLNPTQVNFTRRKLLEASIDPDAAMNWHKEGGSVDAPFFKYSYRPALYRLVRDTIVDPSPIDKPLWMNDERFVLIAQMKGFMTAFTNRVMIGWKDKIKQAGPEGNKMLALQVAPYVAMYLAAQVGVQGIRELLKTGNLDDWDEKSIYDRIWSAMGYMGAVAYPVDAINTWRHGGDPLVSGAGPAPSITFSTVEGLVRSIDSTNPEEQLMKTTLKLVTPNAPGIGWVETFVKDAWGLE